MTSKSLAQTISERFDEKFTNDYPDESCSEDCCGYSPNYRDIKSFIRQELTAILSAYVEEIEGMKKEPDSFLATEPKIAGYGEIVYNSALNACILKAQELIKEIK